MIPDDLFIDDDVFPSRPSLNAGLLAALRAGEYNGASDLEAAFPLVGLLRSEYLQFGTGGGNQLNDNAIQQVQRTCRQVLKRLGIDLEVPWRDFSSFKTYWLANDGYGSWQARRQMVADVFDPIQEALEELEDNGDAGAIAVAVTSHDRLGWPEVDAEIEQIKKAFHRARSAREYREVGLACVALLETLSRVAYDPDKHLHDGEEEPPVGNTKARLSRVIEQELAESDLGKELGRLVQRVAELSQAVKHSPTRTRTEAGVAADTVFLIANIMRRLRPDTT
ncbi:MAG: hypothetical protein M3O70_09265 [Actinomycetota bacterium]|nr:hypothetical protein [Actinomycetota bacterium]